ncbi:MAG: transporter [Aquificae bacterium]|nr:transporter [Aquificota bacterium]
MKKAFGLLLSVPALCIAIGYRIPEQSLRSTATSAAYTASANHADAVHFNPANMSFLKESWLFETGIRIVYLPEIDFRGAVLDPVLGAYVPTSTSSSSETHVAPYLHLVFPPYKSLRFGIAFVTPAGLSKKWDQYPASVYAKEFTLKVYELDFALSWKVNEKLALGGGLRAVYATGTVQLEHPRAFRVELDGDTDVKPGYYLSVSFKPTESLTLSALWRSKVDLDIEGDANGQLGTYPLNTSGDVSVPLPAELRLSVAYELGNTTLEFTLERTFWSSYDWLDFNYDDPVAEAKLGKPIKKDWDDVNTYRFGISHRFGERFEGMLGIAYGQSPIPQESLGFELPEPKYVWILSAGGLYRLNKNWEVGLAYLYLANGERNVNNLRIREGNFSDISAHLITLSVGARF